MPIPQSVIINAVAYTVRVLSSAELWTQSGRDLLGHARYTEADICLVEGMPEAREAQIFIHECMHQIESDAGIDITEQQMRILSNGVFALLRDNPQVVEYLLKAGRE